MTKLMEWLAAAALLGAAWLTLSFDLLGLSLPEPWRRLVWPLPVYLLLIFGCYALATVGFRVATLRDCEDAARELQEQIREARKDLSRRGLTF
uniref:Dolichol-phosphate mannosyltransferase subunit 3 n=1 Tax=Geotrypetes seraphini TaxID=260995 RepID=A0A6P8Q2Z2_GEOSA|nr:dolichol-phosphate mannosyltransferase subunit 3 [Geotrypetes seraphini]